MGRPEEQESPRLALPTLCARASNVGAPLDAYRARTVFHHPRSSRFTTQFQGVTFENHSLSNHARIRERTQRRALLASQRLEALQAYHDHLAEQEERRRSRREGRHAAQLRHEFLARQAAKRRELRELEAQAAVVIQRRLRGMRVRRVVHALRDEWHQEAAATSLQVWMRQVLMHRQRRRRQEEERKAQHQRQRVEAASVIQRCMRRRQDEQRQQAAHSMEHQCEQECKEPAPDVGEEQDALPEEHQTILVKTADEAEIMIPQASAPTPRPNSKEDEVLVAEPTKPAAAVTQHKPQAQSPSLAESRPRRPLPVKRVGGGFRAASGMGMLPSPQRPQCPPTTPDVAAIVARRPTRPLLPQQQPVALMFHTAPSPARPRAIPMQRPPCASPRSVRGKTDTSAHTHDQERALEDADTAPAPAAEEDPDEAALVDMVQQLDGALE